MSLRYIQSVKKVWILLFLLSGSMQVPAQTVRGKVFSAEDKMPLSGVTIRMLIHDSVFVTGCTTDKNGCFSQEIKQPLFQLEISHLGYEKNVLTVHNNLLKNLDLDTIKLLPASISLDNIDVVGKSQLYKADKIVTFPTSKQVKASASSLELLRNLLLPNLWVDPVQESVSIQGTSGIIFRINGVKASFQEVKALRPEDIYRVDYKDVPSIRELNSNSGTIDFILKKPRMGTSLSSNALSAVSTGMVNGNTNLRTNYKKSQFALDYSVNYRDYSKRKNSETETYKFPEETIVWDKRGEYAPFGYTQHNIGLGYLFKEDKDAVNVRFNNSIYSQYDNNRMGIYRNDKHLLNRDIYSESSNYMPSLDVTYIRSLDNNQGVEVNVVGTLSNSDYERNLTDVTIDTKKESVLRNLSNGEQQSVIGEAYYWKEGGKFNFSAGIQSTYQHFHNMYLNDAEASLHNLEVYPYVQLSGKAGNISYTLGTGLQYQQQRQIGKSVDYLRNSMSLSLAYMRDRWSLKYNGSYRTFSPTLSSLSEVVQPIDAFSVTMGNSRLKPFSNWNNRIECTMSNKKFLSILHLYANKSFNPIHQDVVYSPVNKKFVYQDNNQLYDCSYGALLILQQVDIFNFVTAQVFGGWNYYKSKGDLYEHFYHDFYYGFYLNMGYKNFNLNYSWSKPQKRLVGQYLNTGENSSHLGINYKLKQLTLGCGVQFLFTPGAEYRVERLAENALSDRNVLIKNNANMFYLMFSYNIHWGRSIFQSNKRLQNRDYMDSLIKIKDN